jgi:hypothetical protein
MVMELWDLEGLVIVDPLPENVMQVIKKAPDEGPCEGFELLENLSHRIKFFELGQRKGHGEDAGWAEEFAVIQRFKDFIGVIFDRLRSHALVLVGFFNLHSFVIIIIGLFGFWDRGFFDLLSGPLKDLFLFDWTLDGGQLCSSAGDTGASLTWKALGGIAWIRLWVHV